jgi:hypothetical protein
MPPRCGGCWAPGPPHDRRPRALPVRRPPAGCRACAGFLAFAGLVAADGDPVRAGGYLLALAEHAHAALASGQAADAAATLASLLALAGQGSQRGAAPLRSVP